MNPTTWTDAQVWAVAGVTAGGLAVIGVLMLLASVSKALSSHHPINPDIDGKH